MATINSSPRPLQDLLCSDPVHGAVYRMLFNGGSWFEADQLHWKIHRENALVSLGSLTAEKPTKANQEKAQIALSDLKEATVQLCPSPDPALAAFHRLESVVAKWEPKKATAAPKNGVKNTFAALAEDDEEDE
jgi:hypothetical protein